MVSGTPLYNLDHGPKDLNGELVLWTFCDMTHDVTVVVYDVNDVKSLLGYQAFLRVLPFDQLVRVP